MTQIDKPIAPCRGMGLNRNCNLLKLQFVYCNSTFWANFDAGLTTETLISFYRISFSIYHFENLCGTCCYTFFVASTLVIVNNNFKHYTPPWGNKISQILQIFSQPKTQTMHSFISCKYPNNVTPYFCQGKKNATKYQFTHGVIHIPSKLRNSGKTVKLSQMIDHLPARAASIIFGLVLSRYHGWLNENEQNDCTPTIYHYSVASNDSSEKHTATK